MNVHPASEQLTRALTFIFGQPLTVADALGVRVEKMDPAKHFPTCRYSSDGLAALAPNAIWNRRGILVREYLGKGGTPLCRVIWEGCRKQVTVPRRYIEIIEPAAFVGITAAAGPAAKVFSAPSAMVGVGPSEGGPSSQPVPIAPAQTQIVPDSVDAGIGEPARPGSDFDCPDQGVLEARSSGRERSTAQRHPTGERQEIPDLPTAPARPTRRLESNQAQAVNSSIPKAKRELRDELRRAIEATAKMQDE